MIKKLINEGAESRLYSDQVFGYDVVIKERQPKTYRIPQLDVDMRRSRTKNEARIMGRLRKAGVRVPALIAVGTYKIYMEKISGTLLKDLPKSNAKLFLELGKVLAAVHNADVAHGDFTTTNVMVSGNRIVLIDFGLSESTNSIEEKALDLLLIKRSITKPQYAILKRGYESAYPNARATLGRLAKIEERGRYQTRTLA